MFGALYAASLKIVASNEIYRLVYSILLGCLTVAIVLFTVLNHYNKNRDRAKIYTHNVAADIVDEFEDLLDKYDITIPDEEREGAEDEARIYGQAYDELIYKTEISLISLLAYFAYSHPIVKTGLR